MLGNYPVLEIPHSIKDALASLPKKTLFPESPPQSPGEAPRRHRLGILFLEAILVILVSAFFRHWIMSSLIGLFGMIAVGYHALQQRRTYRLRMSNYRKKEESYRTEVSDYYKRKAQFQKEVEDRSSDPIIIAAHKKDAVIKALQYTKGPNSANSLLDGHSEPYFGAHLRRYFPGLIHKNLGRLNPDFSSSKYTYAADFAYLDPKTGLSIDIEIDEPYSFKTREPIHINDYQRNNCFIESGWVVIRFAEEQVCRYPNECCLFIASLINRLVEYPIPDSLKELNPVPEIKQWTYIEAQEMIAQNYRDTYIQHIK